jgi:hypothetical protein
MSTNMSTKKQYKVISVEYGVWAKLTELKVRLNVRSLNDVIKLLLVKCKNIQLDRRELC